MKIQFEVDDPDDIKTLTADSRGRISIGSEYAGETVSVAIQHTPDPDSETDTKDEDFASEITDVESDDVSEAEAELYRIEEVIQDSDKSVASDDEVEAAFDNLDTDPGGDSDE